VDESRGINELKTFRDVVEKLVLPKITAGMFTDQPVELPDGVRKSFTTTRDFYANTLAVYLNGVRQHSADDGDVITSGNRGVSFKTAPVAGDRILFDYVPMDI
jgi:hypothetical protein